MRSVRPAPLNPPLKHSFKEGRGFLTAAGFPRRERILMGEPIASPGHLSPPLTYHTAPGCILHNMT
jgi:hypothetical protein